MIINDTVALASVQPKANKIDPNQSDSKLKEKTNEFEAIFVKYMLDQAMKPETGMMPKGTGSHLYASMYTDSLSKNISGSMGISEMLYNYLRESLK